MKLYKLYIAIPVVLEGFLISSKKIIKVLPVYKRFLVLVFPLLNASVRCLLVSVVGN